jgi:cytidine deaminase
MEINQQQREKLVQQALQAREKAYAPYSKYQVGAALLTRSGQIFCGANVENAAYPMTICAERSAIVQAVSSGEREFDAIAVVTENGGSPCGACRQVMAEVAPDMQVIIADGDGRVEIETTVRSLLPYHFGPEHLPREQD